MPDDIERTTAVAVPVRAASDRSRFEDVPRMAVAAAPPS